MKGALKFEDRLSEAAKAKQAMLEKFRARPAPDPAELAERAKLAEAKELKRQLAEIARKERVEADRIAKEEQKRRDIEAAAEAVFAEQAAADLARAERAASDKALLAQQKAARDARYAARKGKK